jgi:hypothetical protein
VTIFGWIFLPVLLGVCLFRRTWLPGLLLLSAVLQATAIVNLPAGDRSFGVSPYNLTALFAFLVFVLRYWHGERAFSLVASLGIPTLALGLFVLVSVLGAFVLPHVFAGVSVYLLFGPFPMDVPPEPLRWTMSNAVQAVNLCVHTTVLLFLAQARTRNDWQPLGLIKGVSLGFILVLIAGLWERASILWGLPSGNDFWVSNAGYYISSLAALPGGWVRVGTPFSEPSYASVYLVSITLGLLAVAAFGRQQRRALYLAVVAGLALINTFGATGWAAGGVALLALLFWLSAKAIWSRDQFLMQRAKWAWAGMLLITLLVLWLLMLSPFAPKLNLVMDNLIFSKLEWDPKEVRHSSNLMALRIGQDTMGLGVGLGSHRASSFFASLLANTGVLGFGLFVAMLMSLLWRYWRAPHLSDMQIFVAAALPTATLAMGLGIPDLNIPMYWGFIFLGFVFCPGNEADDIGTGDGCPPARA